MHTLLVAVGLGLALVTTVAVAAVATGLLAAMARLERATVPSGSPVARRPGAVSRTAGSSAAR